MSNDIITIVDYGMGNLGSIANMIKKVGGQSIVTSEIDLIKQASKLILPGVGSFDKGMENLYKLGLIDILNQRVLSEKVPILGLCLGMQLMTKSSEEGKMNGLGWVDADTIKFNLINENLKIPHMGWNLIDLKKQSNLFLGMENDSNRFYFVHSYAVTCNKQVDVLATTNYGYEFDSAFEKGNILGVQFHPEKSHKFGIRFFKNFLQSN